MPRYLLLLLPISMFAVVATERADACSCIAPPPPKQAMEGSSAVFTGKVTKVERQERQYLVTFAVSRSWKGPRSKMLVVRTPLDSAACGVNFEAKKEYIVYCHARAAAADGKSGDLETNLCTRTSLLANAKGDLDALGKGHAPQDGDETDAVAKREVEIELTVPSTAHRVCIRAVYRVGDSLWVLSEVQGGIGGAAISKVEATAMVDAPADLPVKHFVLGKDWNWTMEKYEYPASRKAFDELAAKNEAKELATFECFEPAKPEPQPDPAPRAE